MTRATDRLLENIRLRIKFTEMKQICAPLHALGITNFFYMRRYRDGTFINLATNESASHIFFEKLYTLKYVKEDINNHVFMPEGLILSELNAHNKIWQDMKEFNKLGNAAILGRENNCYTEIYGFLSTLENYKINQFYIENIDILKRFLDYFDEKAKDLIAIAEKNKLILPSHYCETHLDKNDVADLRKFFLHNIVNKEGGLGLGAQYDFATLTIKEIECLYWLIQNKTAEEIAIILGKSARTVEKQLDHLKAKFKCHKTSALIQAIHHAGLQKIICDFI